MISIHLRLVLEVDCLGRDKLSGRTLGGPQYLAGCDEGSGLPGAIERLTVRLLWFFAVESDLNHYCLRLLRRNNLFTC